MIHRRSRMKDPNRGQHGERGHGAVGSRHEGGHDDGPHQVIFDAPPEAGGGDEGPSPAEMLLGAVGA